MRTQIHRWALGAMALMAMTLSVGCAQPDAFVDLEITQDVTLLFGAMDGDIAKAQIVEYGNLRSESVFVELEDELACATLNRRASTIEIRGLDADSAVVGLDLSIEIARPGEPWEPLADLVGVVRYRDVFSFDSAEMLISEGGAAWLSETLLSDHPVYDARITGLVDRPVNDLTVDLRLNLALSTDPSACP